MVKYNKGGKMILLTDEETRLIANEFIRYASIETPQGSQALRKEIAKAQLKKVVGEVKRDSFAVHSLDGNKGVGVQLSPEFWQALLKEIE